MHILSFALLAAILGGGVLWALFRRRQQGRLQRLALLAGDQTQAPVLQGRADSTRIAEAFLPRAIVRNLHQLGIETGWREIFLTMAVWGLPVLGAALMMGPLFALLLGAFLLLGVIAVLNILAARRVAALGALLPGFFDRVRQLLSIGNSLPTAFARAVHGSCPILAAFWAPAIRRIGNGASFSESVRQSAEEIDLYEMRLFAAAVATNMRFGGSLTQALNNLVAYLRKRASIERELRSSTAQLRASAWVLGLLPMFVGGLIIVQNRDYARWFITHPTGKLMLAYCILSQLIGAMVMRSIVKTKF